MQTILILSAILLIIIAIFVYLFVYDEYEKKKKSVRESNVTIQTNGGVDTTYVDQGLKTIGYSDEDLKNVKTAIHEQIVGMDEFINTIMLTLLSEGNMLVEGVPGLAKTKTIHTLADVLGMQFSRVQFTPDMLPSDIVGVDIFNPQSREFETKLGPIVSNIILADEINRTTPKVQSALLEAMQEKQVTIGGKTYKLPKPFFVLATQNPIEQEGTYPLPEAQIDRFLCKVLVEYPSLQEEKNILLATEHTKTHTHKPLYVERFTHIKQQVDSVNISDTIKDYITRLVQKTREKNPLVMYGASPRGSISLMQASKALAYVVGRDYVTHEDIQRIVLPVLRHRILLSYEAKIQGVTSDTVIYGVIQQTEV